MLNKFFKFLRGYVIISVSGKNAERFLNICTRREMRVYKAEPSENSITIKIASADFVKIRDIARKCRVRVKIKEKHSASHTLRLYRSRYAFVIAAAVCAFLCVLSTRFIWLVEINGADEDNIDSITATLDEMGVKRGGIKSRLPDGMEMKSRILNGTDNVAWAWVYIEGAKARVEIYEKIMPPAVIDKSVPCDILASCGGVIKSMTVKNGEERVKEGDAVNAGDVLVSGNVSAYREGAEENYIKVHAMADIYAYTTHTASDDFKLYYETRTPTGRYRRHIVLDWFGKTISLPWREVNFEEYDRAEKRRELNIPFFGYSGIAVDTVEYTEVTVNREPMPIETALDIAENSLEEKIAKELTNGAVLTDKSLEYEQTDDETIRATLKMNFTENIAAPAPLGAS